MATVVTIWGRDRLNIPEPIAQLVCLGDGELQVRGHYGVTCHEQLMLCTAEANRLEHVRQGAIGWGWA